MKKTGIAFLALLTGMPVLLQSCKNKTHGKIIEVSSDTMRFYPVNPYIKEQVAKVDSAAVFIYKITVEDGKKDSSILNKQQFNQWAGAFLEYDISDKSIHKYYRENIFMDETTRSITFNYTSADSSQPLQSVDILLDTADQHVKRVFINKVKSYTDSMVTEKGGWKNNESFFINRITERPGKTTIQQNIIVWRNAP
jgi:hypothetical protein